MLITLGRAAANRHCGPDVCFCQVTETFESPDQLCNLFPLVPSSFSTHDRRGLGHSHGGHQNTGAQQMLSLQQT
eukprot:scaffold1564_cov389-Prasinococcus_capsulatus_cf.AAC.22